MKRLNYSITEGTAIVFVDGEVYTVPSTHKNYRRILDVLLGDVLNEEEKIETVLDAVNVSKEIEKYAEGRITIEDGETMLYSGESIPTEALVDRILELKQKGHSFKHLITFLDNLMENPNESSREDLYRFLSKNNLPITSRGTFLAYKKVRDNYRDVYSGTIDNSIGAIVTMPRDKVDPNINEACSTGLHVAAYNYLDFYSGDRVVIVEVNPRDVVSVPLDHNDEKLRCCRYEVVGEIDDYKSSRIKSSFVDVEQEDEYEEEFFEEDGYDEDWLSEDEEAIEDEYDGQWGDEEEIDSVRTEPFDSVRTEPFVEWTSNGVKKSGYLVKTIDALEPLNVIIDDFLESIDYEVSFEKINKVKIRSTIKRYLVEVVAINDILVDPPVLYAPSAYQVEM